MSQFVLAVGADITTSSGLSDIVSFFNTQSVNNDVAGTLMNTGLAFKIAMGLIMFIGAIAMAIWIARIAIDILLLATNNMGKLDALEKFGTKQGGYGSVAEYLRGNLLEIILVILLITLIMTGFLFRLIGVAISGTGMLLNKLFNLDVDGGLSKVSGQSYKEGFDLLRLPEKKVQYDEALGGLKAQADILYNYASEGMEKDNPKFISAQRAYTVQMGKAMYAGTKLTNSASKLNLNSAYFAQHLSSADACNSSFIDTTVLSNYSAENVPSTVKCK